MNNSWSFGRVGNEASTSNPGGRLLARLLPGIVFAIVAVSMGGCRDAESKKSNGAVLTSSSGTEYLAHEVIIKKAPFVSDSRLESALRGLGGAIIDDQSILSRELGYLHIELPTDVNADEAIHRLNELGVTEMAERNYVIELDNTPNDPRLPELWGMAKIQAESAWDHTTGSRDVLVAVIDTGFDKTHPDLGANIWSNPGETPGNGVDDDGNGYVDDIHGWDWVNRDNDPFDDHGHGTHCSGTIGAVGNDDVGVAGVNWKTRIMGLKFLSRSGRGNSWNGAQAILYAAKMKARVVSASWGCRECYVSYMEDAIQTLADSGGLFVAAAGNSNKDMDVTLHHPAGYPVANVVAVAATTSYDRRAYFSNYSENKVHVAAPGYGILSTIPGNKYASWSGTSMAAPHVAGLAALYLSHRPAATFEKTKLRLIGTCDPFSALEETSMCGGRINANTMITADEIPPAAPQGINVEAGERSDVTVSWLPNAEPDLHQYKVAWGTASGQYASQQFVPGDKMSLYIRDLENDQLHYFSVQAVDTFGNISAPSQEKTATPRDTVAPDRVTNLSAELIEGPPAPGQVISSSSEASNHYSANNVFDGNPDTAWLSMPSAEPNEEHFVVQFNDNYKTDRIVLIPSATYPEAFPIDFDIELSWNGADWNPVTGLTNVTVLPGEPVELRYFATWGRYLRLSVHRSHQHTSGKYFTGLAEMTVYRVSNNSDSLVLRFTAPGDDPGEGRAASYDIRYSTSPIDASNFSSAEQAWSPPPLDYGAPHTVWMQNMNPGEVYFFAMTATDEAGNTSPVSNTATATTAVTPPAAIGSLRVFEKGPGEVTLRWMATGSEGYWGQAASYELRYSTSPFTPGNFSAGTLVTDVPTPSPAFYYDLATITGLTPGEYYYFALKSVNADGVKSSLSNVVAAIAESDADTTPPATVGDLAMLPSKRDTKLALAVTDQSSNYDYYFSADRLVDGNKNTMWSSGSGHAMDPEWVIFDLGDLQPVTRFRMLPYIWGDWLQMYPQGFDIQLSADGINWTTVVHVENHEGRLGEYDEWSIDPTYARYARLYINLRGVAGCIEPRGCDNYIWVSISEFEIWASTPSFDVDIFWVAPGDDEWIGTADDYDLRRGTNPITNVNFLNSTPTPLGPPQPAGMLEYTWVGPLAWETDHYFALKTVDEAGNWSGLSNVATITAPPLPPAPVTDLRAESTTKTSVSLQWTASGDDGLAGTASLYDLRYSLEPIHDDNWDLAIPVNSLDAPALSGAAETFTIEGLEHSTVYYFALKVIDDLGASSILSNIVLAQTQDGVAPSAVHDLHAEAMDPGSASPLAVVSTDSSGSYSGATSAQYLTDGNTDTIWISPPCDPYSSEFVVFHLAELTALQRIRLVPAPGYSDLFPADFSIAVRADASAPWTTKVDESWFTTNGGAEEWMLGAVLARQVRLNVTRGTAWAGDFYAALGEVEIYADGFDDTTVQLSWTAPGDDGALGSADEYDLRHSMNMIENDTAFAAAISISPAPAPQPAGTAEQLDVRDLESDSTYCFALKSTDELSNVSPLSNSVCAETATVPPGTIDDLQIAYTSETTVMLAWTARGSSGSIGRAAAYEMAKSSSRINTANWDLAQQISNLPAPAAAGGIDSFEIEGLEPATRYYFALRALDAEGTPGAISANAVASTTDFIPPEAVTDLAATTNSSAWGSLTITWTAPGDVGPLGHVHAYDLRVSPLPISEGNFSDALQVDTSAPQPGGNAESTTITGLDPERLYYVALKSSDTAGNMSAISNVASAETRDEAPAAVTDLAIVGGTGDEPNEATLTVQWTSPGDDANIGTATSYDIRYSPSYINLANFEEALTASDTPTPASAGTTQQITITGLDVGSAYYVALKSSDEKNNTSPISNVATGTTPDGVAPGRVTDLLASTGSTRGSVNLTWTGAGDDGLAGYITQYDLRYSTSEIDAANFDSATPAPYQPMGHAGGTARQYAVTGLSNEIELHFALRARDDAGNWSPVSNDASARTPDVAPARVDDLAQTLSGVSSITVTWTAPGDDDNTGRAAVYDLRISEQMITFESFGSSTRVETNTPAVSGSTETVSIDNLDSNTIYYLALKAADERGNWSTLSNVLTAHTADNQAPAQIQNLTAATGLSAGQIILTWTSPGDDGQSGRASLYELRRSLQPVTASNWSSAIPVTGLPAPKSAGAGETFTATGLDGETVHHLALRAVDEAGNAGPVSNDVFAETQAVPPAAISDLSGEVAPSATVHLRWTATGDDGDQGTAVEYDIRYSTNTIVWYSFDYATQVTDAPTPSVAGTTQDVSITGLEESTTYWFAIKAIDDKNAKSNISNVISLTTLDETAPAAPLSLNMSSPEIGGEQLDIVAAEASSELSASLGAENIIDDDALSYWVSAGSASAAEETLILDLGTARECDLIKLLPDETYVHLFPRNFAVSLSDDKNTWLDVVEIEDFEISAASWLTLGFAAETARYLRLTMYDPATSFFGLHYAAIAEAEAYEARPPDGRANLTWVAPGDDDNSGTAHRYEVYRHTAPFDEATLTAATLISGAPSPQSAGSMQTMTVTSLIGEQRYYFAIRAVDEAGNVGTLSQAATGITRDVAPAPVSDLRASSIGRYAATMIWTAPGDDGDLGTAAEYEMRYAPWPLTTENYPLATAVSDLPEPLPAGESQYVSLSGLEAGTLYRVAMIARDEAGTTSHLSNIALVSTESEPDTVPPTAVTDLAAEALQTGGQTIAGTVLTWSSEQPPDFAASKLIDSNRDSMWSSEAQEFGGDEWVRIDLGETLASDRVRIWPSDSFVDLFPPGIEIRTSLDGIEWATVFAEIDYVAIPGTPLEGAFPATPVRYLEVVATDLAPSDNGYFYAVVAEIELLTAAAETGTIVATWTATGDDGETGRAADYDLRLGSCPYDHSAAVPIAIDEPKPPSTSESARITDLVDGTYCLGLKVVDESGNSSALSNVSEVNTNGGGQ